MSGFRTIVILAAALSVMISTPGCKNGFSLVDTGSIFQMPWNEKPDTMPGITAPHERMAELRKTAAGARGLGPAEQETLSQRLAKEIRGESDPLVRLEIVRAISACKTPTADSVLETAVEDDSPDVRATVCEELGRRGGPQAVRLLSKAVASDMNADVRLAATRALGETGDPAAVAGLGVALDDGDPTMQYRAVLSLKKVSDKDFGKDIGLWRQYVKGENPSPPEPVSLAERIRDLF